MNPPTPKRPAPDLKLASSILVQLNVLRKNTRIYADTHPALLASVQRALQHLEQFFSHGDDFSLVVTKDSAHVGGVEIPLQNAVVAEFVTFLHDQSVYVLTVKRGISGEALLKVVRLLAADTGSLQGVPLDLAAAEAGGGHVELRLVEWSSSEFVEVTEVDLTQARDGTAGENSWESFIRHLLQQGADDLQTWAAGLGADRIAAAATAEEPSGPGQAAADAQTIGKVLQGAAGAGAPAGVWERVRRVASCVDPGLRLEMLQSLQPPATSPQDAAILEEQDSRLVLEVLEGLTGAGAQVHPKAVRLAEALAGVDRTGQEWRVAQLDRAGRARELSENLRAFLTSTGFPPPPVADSTEEPLRLESAAPPAADGGQAPAGELFGAAARTVRPHYASTLLDLLQGATTPAIVELCGRALAGFIQTSALAGNWDAVTAAWTGLADLAARPELGPSIRDACEKAKTQYGDAEKLARLAASLLAFGVDKARALLDIVRLAGPSQAAPLVEAVARDERESVLPVLLPLLIEMKAETLPHVYQRLADTRGAVICRMLRVLQQMGDRDFGKVEKLLARPELEVRLEALRSLALLGSPRAPALLLRVIRGTEGPLALGAIEMSRHVSSPEVTEALLAILRDSRWNKPDYDLERKAEAARALIAAGRPEALHALCQLIAKRPLFHGKAFQRLRVEIFQALAKADVTGVEEFLRLGRGLREPEIATSCREIERRLRGGKGPAKPATGKPA